MKRIFALLAAALLISACAKSPEDALVGSWNNADDDLTIQFFDGGTITYRDGRRTGAGDFEILDENQMRLNIAETGDEPETVVLGYRFEGDDLILVAPDGDEIALVKVD